MQKVGAAVAQLFSLATTVAFVVLFTQAADPRGWGATAVYSILLEALLFAFKEGLFRKHPALVFFGFIGVAADGIINTGGILQIATGLLTFQPVMIMLGVAEVDMGNPDQVLTATFIASLILGIVLSLAPHVLWRDWSKKGAAKTA